MKKTRYEASVGGLKRDDLKREYGVWGNPGHNAPTYGIDVESSKEDYFESDFN